MVQEVITSFLDEISETCHDNSKSGNLPQEGCKLGVETKFVKQLTVGHRSIAIVFEFENGDTSRSVAKSVFLSILLTDEF